MQKSNFPGKLTANCIRKHLQDLENGNYSSKIKDDQNLFFM